MSYIYFCLKYNHFTKLNDQLIEKKKYIQLFHTLMGIRTNLMKMCVHFQQGFSKFLLGLWDEGKRFSEFPFKSL